MQQATTDRVIAAILKGLNSKGTAVSYEDVPALVVGAEDLKDQLAAILNRVLPAELGAEVRRQVRDGVDPVRKQLASETYARTQAEEKHTRSKAEVSSYRDRLAEAQQRAVDLGVVLEEREADNARLQKQTREGFTHAQKAATALQKLGMKDTKVRALVRPAFEEAQSAATSLQQLLTR